MSIDAGTITIEIEAKADKLASGLKTAQAAVGTSTNAMKRDASTVAQVIEQANGSIEQSSGRAGASQMILQGLVRRTTDQIAAGGPVATIFAEHISGLVEAAELAGSSFGKFGEVLAGPWGLALSAGVSIAAILAQHLYGTAEASDVHKKATLSLAQAIDELNGKMAKESETTEQSIIADINKAKGLYAQELAVRKLTIAKLESAKADATTAQASNVPGAPSYETGSGAKDLASAGYAAGVQQQLDAENKRVVEIGNTYIEATAKKIGFYAVDKVDKASAAEHAYARTVSDLDEQFKKAKISQAALSAGIEQATRVRDAARKSGGGGGTGDADAQARLATATNGLQRAEAELSITRRDANRELKAGTITQAEYEAKIESGMRAVNDAKAAAKEHASAVREQAAAERDLASSLEALQSRFDPVAAASAAYVDAIKDIDNLEAAKRIDAETAALYRQQAAYENIADTAAALDKQQQARRDEIFGKDYGKAPDKMSTASAERNIENSYENGPFGDKAAGKQKRQIADLASFYEKLFRGGTKNIFKDFEQEGEKMLAQLLAKLTVQNLGGLFGGSPAAGGAGGGAGGLLGGIGSLLGLGKSGGGLFGAIGGLLGDIAIPGFADGGDPPVGRVSIVGERGPELFVPRSAGTIVPNHALNIGSANGRVAAQTRPTLIQQTVHVDASNSVNPDGFEDRILAKSAQIAQRLDQHAAKATLAQTPGVIRSYQQMKG